MLKTKTTTKTDLKIRLYFCLFYATQIPSVSDFITNKH